MEFGDVPVTSNKERSEVPLTWSHHPWGGWRERAWLIATLLLGGWILGSVLLGGWYPHDEGALGQSAERVLLGQVPHRDFDEIYTGLLSYLHALVFQVGGIKASSLRYLLFGVTSIWMVTCYCLARRLMPPVGAAGVTILLLTWSVPIYPAALPSWYNLFCATWVTWALINWHETHMRWWLLVGGIVAGISVLFKLSGAFLILGGLLALWDSSRKRIYSQVEPGKVNVVSISLAVLGLIVIALLWKVAGGETLREFTRFVVPTGLIVTALALAELRSGRGTTRQRWDALQESIVPFLAGVAIPLSCFALWFAAIGGFSELIHGVFLAPFQRTKFATMPPPVLWALFGAMLPLYLLWPRVGSAARRAVHALLAVVGLALLLDATGHVFILFRYVWWSAWVLPTLVAVLGSMLILDWKLLGVRAPSDLDRTRIVTLTCIAVPIALIEFPFAAQVYSHYAISLAMLAVVAMCRAWLFPSPTMQVVTVTFYLLFALVRLIPLSVNDLWIGRVRQRETAFLDLPRAGLRVPPEEATVYGNLVKFIQQEGQGRRIWAGPDAPEIYFLTGYPNHTRVLFDFLGAGYGGSDSVISQIEAAGVSMVILNLVPDFSSPPNEKLLNTLNAGYPHNKVIGPFVVLWR